MDGVQLTSYARSGQEDGNIREMKYKAGLGALLLVAFMATPALGGNIGYWEFENNLLDSSGNDRTLTAAGTAPVYSTDITAGLPAGSKSAILSGSVLTSNVLVPLSNFTVDFYFKTTQPSSQWRYIVTTLDHTLSDSTGTGGWVIGLENGTGNIFAHNNFRPVGGSSSGANDVNHTITSSRAVNDGEWHRATLTISAENIMALYLDGVLVGSEFLTHGVDPDRNAVRLARSWSADYPFWFTGSLDQVRILDEVLSPYTSTSVSFVVLSDSGQAMDDGVIEFGSEELQASHHIQHQALIAIQGNGDDRGDAGESGHVLSRMGYGGRVISLADDNDEADAVTISGHGRINNNSWGDLTNAVRFANDHGFGLDNGPDGEAAAKFLNSGDCLTFRVGTNATLGKAAFTVKAKNAVGGADVKLAADGNILSSGAKVGGGGVADFALDLGLVQDGSEIVIDLIGEQASYVDAHGVHVTLSQPQIGAMISEFVAAGSNQISIGSHSGDGLAIRALRLEVSTGF